MISTSSPLQYVIIVTNDVSGCSYIRLRWHAIYLQQFMATNVIPVVVPNMLFDETYLMATKAVIFQCPTSPEKYEQVQRTKALQPKYGYKLIAEFDDCVWEDLPEYSEKRFSIDTFGNKIRLGNMIQWFDTVTVSTEYLKHVIETTFDYHGVTVIENVLPLFMWQQHRTSIAEKIEKPVVLYAGAPQHYRNPMPISSGNAGISGHHGDWSDEWIDFIVENVKNDKISFVCMGGLPYFFEAIKDKIQVIDWVDVMTYPRVVQGFHPDFMIAPLTENSFNKCKSNLKLLEAAALGAVFIGDKFANSPYENTKTTLADFWKYTEPTEYNKIIEWQDRYMQEHGGYLEMSKHINKFIALLEK